MKRDILLVVLALILIVAGLILVSISLSPVPQDQTLINSIVQLPANSPYSSRGVSASYFLNGNSNGKINGTMLMIQCCVSFYIFDSTAWQNFQSNGYRATNSTNSPAFTLNSTAIDAKSGVSPLFTFIPDSSKTYELVFFNENRSLWNTNSTVTFRIITDITLNYTVAPAKLLVYPGALLIAAGAAIIILRGRLVK